LPGTNLLRVSAMKKMRLKQFEFSQNWLLFGISWKKRTFFLRPSLKPPPARSPTARLGSAAKPGFGRRAMEHVRQYRKEIWLGSKVGHAGDGKLL